MTTHVLRRRIVATRPSPALSLMQTLALWLRRAQTRPRLDLLSDHELRDLGLDRGTACREAARPFWQG
jgi:uncharacterized protein YjiS (DUF1127 family)